VNLGAAVHSVQQPLYNSVTHGFIKNLEYKKQIWPEKAARK
jgi:hypothetical protein